MIIFDYNRDRLLLVVGIVLVYNKEYVFSMIDVEDTSKLSYYKRIKGLFFSRTCQNHVLLRIILSFVLIFFFVTSYLTISRLPTIPDHELSAWETNIEYLTTCQPTNHSLIYTKYGIRQTKRLVYPSYCNLTSLTTLSDAGICRVSPKSSTFSWLSWFSFAENKKIQCLPSFMIIGTMKSGTGELMKWLHYHPLLALGTRDKQHHEIHYFDQFKDTNKPTLHEYISYFPMFSTKQTSFQYTFEKSPSYIRSKKVLTYIQQTLPHIKLIVILRNPLIRSMSEFLHHCRHHRFIRLYEDIQITLPRNQTIFFHKDKIYRIARDKWDDSTSNWLENLQKHQEFTKEMNKELNNDPYFLPSIFLTSNLRKYQLIKQCSITLAEEYFQQYTISERSSIPEIQHSAYDQQLQQLYSL